MIVVDMCNYLYVRANQSKCFHEIANIRAELLTLSCAARLDRFDGGAFLRHRISGKREQCGDDRFMGHGLNPYFSLLIDKTTRLGPGCSHRSEVRGIKTHESC